MKRFSGISFDVKRLWHPLLFAWCIVVALLSLCETGVASAEDSTRIDCRYEGSGRVSQGNADQSELEVFPENDVFRPLLADPKQPRLRVMAGDEGARR